TGGQPLHVALAIARRGAQRVRVVHPAAPHDGDGFKAAVRVPGEAGYLPAMVHAPAVATGEILAEVAAAQLGSRAQRGVAARIEVLVVGAEQERVASAPMQAKLLPF